LWSLEDLTNQINKVSSLLEIYLKDNQRRERKELRNLNIEIMRMRWMIGFFLEVPSIVIEERRVEEERLNRIRINL